MVERASGQSQGTVEKQNARTSWGMNDGDLRTISRCLYYYFGQVKGRVVGSENGATRYTKI